MKSISDDELIDTSRGRKRIGAIFNENDELQSLNSELRAALEGLLPMWESGISEPWVVAARAALAKARKPTPGPWTYYKDEVWATDKGTVAVVSHDLADWQANARLIAEAGTVASETGLTPQELLNQREELLELLKDIHAHLSRGGKVSESSLIFAEDAPAIEVLGKAIAKTVKGG